MNAVSDYLQYIRKSSIRMLYEDEHLRIYRKMKTKDKFLHYVDTNERISGILRFLHIRDNQEATKEIRTIYINNVKPKFYSEITDVPLKYKSNSIKTSKYTIFNFLPKNLFEQFRRIVNLYYLINIICMFLIPDPPTSPTANLIPIIFVIGVTAIKQGYEDILRHKSDREINNLPTKILRNGKFEKHSWKSIKVGDIVEVPSDEQIPCDLLLLHSNAENSVCCVTTANLDGESNLKIRSVPAKFPAISTPEEFSKLRAVIKCDKPNGDFYEFKGKMIVDNHEYPIVNENILLRGCRVKISPVIYGVAIYTGQDTKMMINSKFKSNKISCIERRANLFIGIFLVILAILSFGCFFGTLAYNDIYNTHWYLWGSELAFYFSNRSIYNLCNLILYMNLFNYIIPLSMYVTVELQRFVGSQFIECDLKMYDEKNDQPAKANSSDLNEDLGQVEYLFSDKTGTLTENFMEFKQFSINGEKFEERDGKLYKLGVDKEIFVFQNENLVRFFQIMSLCHTVHVEEENEEKYQASSPDEFSFVKFCLRLGVEFVGDEKDENSPYMIRVVKFRDQIYKYQILNILEFDSDRKRMSIIVKDLLENRILLLSKGAETSIFKKCTSERNSQLIQTCDADIHMFAHQGWRTLALAYKYISDQEYARIDEMIKNSYNDILHRKEMLAKCYEEVEDGLDLLGATAVEDKLQEDVSDTLEKLRKGGIKIWVLTGDKRETAINISNSCKHFSDSMIKLMLTDIKQPAQIKSRLEHFIKIMTTTQSYALIIDGMTLKIVFDNKLHQEFKQVCMQCEAVLCCRMTPAQKAQVVRLIKKSKEKPMTAAIGDGANDVSMIQEAHVGLGIFGKEGRNAARCADFAFSKFKYTRRLLLVHGYLYYTRASVLVHYFFYKNLAFALCQFFFAFSNAFTVTSLYGSLILTLYNVVLTSAPILVFGLFEQRVNIPTLEKNPYLYRVITRNRYLRIIHFIKWNLLAVWHAIVVYFFSYAVYAPATSLTQDGKETDSTSFGALIATQIIVLVHLKLFIEWRYKCRWVIFSFTLSFLGYVIFCLIINAFIIPDFLVSLTDYQNTYYSFFYFFATGPTWFLMIVAMFTAILPDMIINVIENIQENMLIKKARHEEFKRERKMNKEVSFVNYTDNDNGSNPSGSNQGYETDASLVKKSSTTNVNTPKVRVFYIPTNQSRVSDTKVKEEVMVLSSSSDHDFYNTPNPTSRTQLNPPSRSMTETSSDSTMSGDDKDAKIFTKKKLNKAQ